MPRLQNEEADDLTNWEFSKFDLAKRVEVDLEKLPFGVLHELLETSEDFFGQVESARAVAREARASGADVSVSKRLKRRPGEGLKESNPW